MKDFPNNADIIICGAGIAGIAAAYWLSVQAGIRDIVLIDERPPLTLTSDKSTECYRNWWPGPGSAMVQLMNRSIDIMEEMALQSGNPFQLSKRGYLYATADLSLIEELEQAAHESSALGAGPVRYHMRHEADPPYVPADAISFDDDLTGCDFFLDPMLIQETYPYLNRNTVAVLHARRCGWLSAHQLGMYMLERAKENGCRLLSGRVSGVDLQNDRVSAVHVESLNTTEQIETECLVNAAGPALANVSQMMDVEIPVFHELHLKIAIEDSLCVVPREAPMLIWMDENELSWSEEERALLPDSEELRWLLDPLPPGVHLRPEGGPDSQTLLLLWSYHTDPVKPVFPIKIDPAHAEIVLRGMSAMVPGLVQYLEKMPKPSIDGGYYTKTMENRPLIGKLPVDGAYVIGALSGFGIMAACAAGELLAAYVTQSELPEYADAFSLARYDDPDYQKLLASWDSTGQL